LTGLDAEVRKFLEKDGEALEFLARLQSLFDYLLPRYGKEKKRYFTVDIGCTGGRHRSVYLADTLGERLRQKGYRVLVRHRDLQGVGR
ncbi:MAG: RNase adaptor protein RapZ, partial [Magnetococcales bacterium]|nr:RNase adaptor protein RapZ [Magnetococcales bacterium]